ncbi:hypothetical protein MKW94_019252 [Papaver nudicaule]|uniref:Glycosyltransferase n=1 Tax=Papaver nudicaule TaxID=74823 RepID=A0AA41SMC9_PAPNU|nr:hypothetical protein [Papaver nudicaule]MCL7041158.1 hypothetical protein [Papaver nudicaule]
MVRQPHVLVLPWPAQGHVMPLMQVSQQIVDNGVKVTFAITESIHSQVLANLSSSSKEGVRNDLNRIRLVSRPEGLEYQNQERASDYFEELVRKINDEIDGDNGEEKVSCVIADATVYWAYEPAKKLGLKIAMFCPTSLAVTAMTLHIPKLIEMGIIDENGTPLKHEMIKISPALPEISIHDFLWLRTYDQGMGKLLFHVSFSINKSIKTADWVLCNSFDKLEPAAYDMLPYIQTIGPLVASSEVNQTMGQFWAEDSTCLTWLDSQPVNSVIYIAFGSITTLKRDQFSELVHGLDLTGRQYLLVIRSDMTNASITYPGGFTEKGRIVNWAPQREVLAHPSVACFMTHCGWNSTMDGLRFGIPLLCWPYFADQIHNSTYVSDEWKTGLRLNKDGNGIVSRNEIKSKVEELIADEGIKTRVAEMKKLSMESASKGGSSSKNFYNFVEALKC